MKTEKENQIFSKLIHGGDYNPEQWLDRPDILEEDIRLMKKAGVNCVSLGIFSWARLEPEEDIYDTKWLEQVIQRLYLNGISTVLATPSAAIPPWLSYRYKEVLQVQENGVRNFPGGRHNFCPTSPVMRDKIRKMDSHLAERLGRHPGVIAWHISNECGGNGREAACHCELCQAAFRRWLQKRYRTLEALNRAWWTDFWSHRYTGWEQIHSPSICGENELHGLKLDWKRFVSDQLLDFVMQEIQTVKLYSDRPVTTNMMGFFKPLNYFKWAKHLDFISWDCYPYWHSEQNEYRIAAETALTHSLMRSLQKKPFWMMESTPSLINWRPVNTLKRPGMHMLSSMQAVAYGSQSVQYFQWRKSRGSCEKFHGAVVDHKNGSNTRVFQDVAEVGKRLKGMEEIVRNTCNQPKAAMVFDWENRWALEDAWAVVNKLDYYQLFCNYYEPLWKAGIEVDVVDMESSLTGYQIVIAPYNYMYRSNYEEKVREYVRNGGCYVTTCWSGEVDESDLCFLGRHPLADVLGIRTEEIDAPSEHWNNHFVYQNEKYKVAGLCQIVHAETASVEAVYGEDFYAGTPAITCNQYGEGQAWYLACEGESGFLDHFLPELAKKCHVESAIDEKLPEGVTASRRIDSKGKSVIFLQNFNRKEVEMEFENSWYHCETGEKIQGKRVLPEFSCLLLTENFVHKDSVKLEISQS